MLGNWDDKQNCVLTSDIVHKFRTGFGLPWHVNFWYDKKAYLASNLQEKDMRETLVRIAYDSSIIGGVNKNNVKSLTKQRL